MNNAARAVAAAIALLFLAFGALYFFSPEGRLNGADLEATSNLGVATARSLIGGGFLTFGILLVMHTVIGRETGALRLSILFLLLSLLGRILSLAADGTGHGAVANLVPVGLMLIASVAALVMFERSNTAALDES